MYGEHDDAGKRRTAAAAATLAIHAAIAAGLIWGLSPSGESAPPPGTGMVTVDFEPLPPPPPPPPATGAARKPAGNTGAKAEALPRAAPEAVQPLATTPAAPVAGDGSEASAGAGTEGQGAGAGAGSADGGGGDGGFGGSPAQRIAGALRDSDYPRGTEAAGTTAISFRVRTDGRVDRCTVIRSSGSTTLDQLTCKLFTERYRFRPATNARGEATESVLQTSFTWGTRRR